MNIETLKILLIEDEIAYADWIDAILAEQKFPSVEIKHVKRIQEALISLSEHNFDAILLDLSLPDSQGMESIIRVKQQTSHLPIIVLTHSNDRELALRALSYGVQDYLIKRNFTGELLIRSICYAMERQRAEAASRQQALMKKMLDRIRQSLNLNDILDNTVTEVRQFLNADRVLIYRDREPVGGEIIAQSSKAISLEKYSDRNPLDFLQLNSILNSDDGVNAIEDISKASPKESKILADRNIKSILTLAISGNSIIKESIDTSNALSDKIESNFLPVDDRLIEHSQKIPEIERQIPNSDLRWGMLIAYNENTPRKWRDWEIDFLQQLKTQVTIAIQQSELYRKLQDINRKLEKLAILDGLTGVANRRNFDRVLKNEWQRLAREQKPLSLILCDIDRFKLYNDTYGHPSGDRCLQAVAKVLKTAVKRPADLVARYGGEEFAVILPDTDLQGAYFIANKMRRDLAELKITHQASSVSPYVTLSIGVATQTPNYHLSPSKLIDLADRLLYQAKRQGRDYIETEVLDRVT